MITRIVKLTFDPARVEEFKLLFNETQHAIQSSRGCLEVKLMKDVSKENVFFTMSKWDSEEDLNAYRKSALFDKVWTQTKTYFNDKPEAWSLEEFTKF